MNNAIKNVMLDHYLNIIKDGMEQGNVESLREFLSPDFNLCDWARREIVEDGFDALNYFAGAIARSKHIHSIEIVNIDIDGVSDRGYKTPFEKKAVFVCYVEENQETFEKRYFETLFCLQIAPDYTLAGIVTLDDAAAFINCT